jgi:predicted TIM-barrel fold metal-dependent hydrolase
LIIDAHTHLIDPPYIHEKLTFTIADGQVMRPDAFRDQITTNQLLQDMDQHNIDKAIVIASDVLSNENLSRITKNNKRLQGLSYIHPLEPDSLQKLEHAITQLGLIGLKLVPDFQDFSMGDPRIHPFLEKAAELAVPVMVHSAPGLIKGHYTQSLPEHFDAIKKNIPDIILVISHMSYPRFIDLLNIVPKEGIYVDTSTTLPWIINLYGIEFTRRYIQSIGAENVLFGSDWWGLQSEIEKQINSIKKLEITEQQKKMILGENAAKLFKL